jgi:hypothetical protein
VTKILHGASLQLFYGTFCRLLRGTI